MHKFIFTLLIALQLFSPVNFSFAYDIPPPPAKGSAAEREDFRILHEYQDNRTDEECAAADLQTIPSLGALFGPSTGVLTANEVKSVSIEGTLLIKKVFSISDPFKDKYKRPRPYNADTTIHPCIRRPGGNKAYPSAHSAVGIALASFLAQKFPSKRTEILEQGKQIGINRLIGGVHHPSDVAAGQSLGKQIAKDLNEL